MSSPPPSPPPPPRRNQRPNLPDEPPAIPLEPDLAAARSKFLRDNIDVVKSLKAQGKSVEEITAAVPIFAENYPALFKMLFKIDIDSEAKLRTMLAMLERMGQGQMTQDQASGVVGQRLYDAYVKPHIDETKER